jgi:hypothetical protein
MSATMVRRTAANADYANFKGRVLSVSERNTSSGNNNSPSLIWAFAALGVN